MKTAACLLLLLTLAGCTQEGSDSPELKLSQRQILTNAVVAGDLARNAVLAYALDHEGKLPDAASWQDDVKPYYERLYSKIMESSGGYDSPEWLSLNVPAPGAVLECELGGGKKTGFAYNASVEGKNTKNIVDKTTTVLIWETSNPVYNAHGRPEDRNQKDPIRIFGGDYREWMDFTLEGSGASLEK